MASDVTHFTIENPRRSYVQQKLQHFLLRLREFYGLSKLSKDDSSLFQRKSSKQGALDLVNRTDFTALFASCRHTVVSMINEEEYESEEENMSDEDNSKTMSEEELIDSLFIMCDWNKSGEVPVSRLTEYVTYTTSNNTENEEDLKYLSLLLDPEGQDRCVTLDVYRGVMSSWIQRLRKKIDTGSEYEDLVTDSKLPELPEISSEIRSNTDVSTSSSLSHDMDSIELQNRIADLQFQNKKFSEENSKLHSQLDGQEEALTNSAMEINILQRKLKNLQEIVDLRQETMLENEDLKARVDKLQDKCQTFDDKISLLERENIALKQENLDTEKQNQNMHGVIESLRSKNSELQSTITQYKHKMTHLTELKVIQEYQLNKRFNEVNDLQKRVEVLNKTIQNLKQEKDDIQSEYTQSQLELHSLRMCAESLGLQEGDSDCSEAEDNKEVTPPLKHQGLFCSTPIHPNHSIGMELREMLDDTKHLPSPLCEREFHTEDADYMAQKYNIESDLDGKSDIMSVSFKEDLTMEISKFVDKYKQKQCDLLSEVERFLNTPDECGDKDTVTEFTENLQAQMDKLGHKFTALAKAKDMADQRLKSLQQKCEKLQDENFAMRRVVEESSSLLAESDKDLDGTVDNRLLVMRDKIVEGRNKIRFLEKQLKAKDTALVKASKSNQEKTFVTTERVLREEIQRLNKCNQELQEKCHKSEVNVACMRDEKNLSSKSLAQQKMKCEELEESLAAALLARQLDLNDIWRLVQRDVEREIQDEQSNGNLPDSNGIKEKIAKEIEHLKVQLVKNQQETHKKLRPEKLSFRPGCGCFGQTNGSSASSPLVEALNIDFMNGNDVHKLHCILCRENDQNAKSENSTGTCDAIHSANRRCLHMDKAYDTCNDNGAIITQGNSSSSSTSGVLDMDYGTALDSTNSDAMNSSKQQYAHHLWLDRDCDDTHATELKKVANSQSALSFHSCCGDDMHKTEAKLTASTQSTPSFHSCHREIEGYENENNNYLGIENVSLPLRRESYEAAIANQNMQLTGAYYPRYRSGSFLAALENGQEQLSPAMNSSSDMMSVLQNTPVAADHEIASTLICDHRNNSAFSVASTLDFTVNSSYLTCTDSSHNHTYCDSANLNTLSSLSTPVSDSPGFQTKDSQAYPPRSGFSWRDPHMYRGISMSSSSFSSDSSFDASCDICESPTTARKLSVLVEEEDAADTDHEGKGKQLLTNSEGKGQQSYSDIGCHNNQHCSSGQSWSQFSDIHRRCADTSKKQDPTKVDVRQLDRPWSTSSDPHLPGINSYNVFHKSNTIDERGDHSSDKDVKLLDCPSTLVCQMQKLTLHDKSDHTDSDLQIDGEIERGVDSMSLNHVTSPLSRIRQDNIVKRREQMQYMRMPDLTETQEAVGASSGARSASENTTVNGHHSSGDDTDKEDNPVLPSIPDSFLQKLGLSTDQDEEISPDQLTDQEIENKFTSLALAFKTDKITLDKRLEIQERSRDIAEENVAKEISGIREAWDKLNQIILDTQVREVLLKIQKHLDVLEQVTSRLSGRAEVYGAVQQERRMSKAIEVMLSHVENLRMVHEREHNELEEARKMIQDSRPFGGSSSLEIGEYGLKGRSLSVCQASALQPRSSFSPQLTGFVTKVQGPRRRVSEVVIPRAQGGATLSHSASVDTFSDIVKFPGNQHDLPVFEEDPKSKFQHIVASTAMKNSIGNTMRRASMEKQASTSSISSLHTQSRENSVESKNGLPVSQRVVSPNCSEEDAYQKGFEQGIKAQIGGKLASLREQQNSISEKLEEIQDKCEEDDNVPSIDFKEMIVRKFWEVVPEWETASKKLRLTMAGFVFFMALCSIFLSFVPLGQATMQVYPQYKHMDKPPF